MYRLGDNRGGSEPDPSTYLTWSWMGFTMLDYFDYVHVCVRLILRMTRDPDQRGPQGGCRRISRCDDVFADEVAELARRFWGGELMIIS